MSRESQKGFIHILVIGIVIALGSIAVIIGLPILKSKLTHAPVYETPDPGAFIDIQTI